MVVIGESRRRIVREHRLFLGESRIATHAVDRSIAARAYEPRARVVGLALAWPLFERRAERILQRLLGGVEIAEETDQRGEHAARLGAKDPLEAVCEPAAAAPRHAGTAAACCTTGRTSIEPVLAAGMRSAIAMASSRLAASIRK